MKFNPGLVVPVYNHGAGAGTTVAALSRNGYPIYLVDDGSDASTAAELDCIARQQPLVRLVRRPVNGGKGAAVMDGMYAAWRDGLSHVLQVDADGQHALDDVARFIDAARQAPDQIICGVPVFDPSVPKGRLYGRYFTHVWVWIETLSLDIRDSMCGFRVYPLAPALKLIETVSIGRHMEFDTEILVRLYWRGLRIVNLQTRVTYPADGISHFRLLQDNLRISWMHTRLAIGTLPRIPLLLARKFETRS